MEYGINFLLGIGLIAYGLYTFLMRQLAPEKLRKLQSMKEELGPDKANNIHIIGYAVMPVVAGILLVFSHFRT